MELEELKDIWNKKEFHLKNEDELATMLKGNSRSLVDKLERSVWFELILTMIAGLALLVYAFNLPGGSVKWTSVSIIILFVGYSFYYVKKLMLFSAFRHSNSDLKTNLESLANNLSAYLHFYKRSYTILYPVYFGLGLVFGLLDSGSDRFIATITEPKTFLYLIGLAVVFFFLGTWFADWYLKKLYGNHLTRLQAIIRELNSTEG